MPGRRRSKAFPYPVAGSGRTGTRLISGQNTGFACPSGYLPSPRYPFPQEAGSTDGPVRIRRPGEAEAQEDGRIRQFTSVGTAPDITVRRPATIFPMRFTGYPPGVFRGSGMRAAAATGPAGSAEERMHRNILCCRRGRPTTRRRTARRCPIMCGRFRCRRWSIWAPVPTAEEARKG